MSHSSHKSKKKTINSNTLESTKKQIFETIKSFAKKQIVESIQKNSSIIIIFMSTSKIILKTSFFSFNITMSSIKSRLSILSTRNALKKHFVLRYRLNFFDSLNLLMMSYMKNAIDLNQILKSCSYKKIMKNFDRNNWITIMKNENNFFLINKTWFLTNAFKNKQVLRDKWIYKIKKTNATKFYVTKHDELCETLNKSKNWTTRKSSFRWWNWWVTKLCTSSLSSMIEKSSKWTSKRFSYTKKSKKTYTSRNQSISNKTSIRFVS